MDRILKQHFDAFRDKGELPPELHQLNGEVKLFGDKELLDAWRNNFKGIQWTDGKGNIFKGAVDNIIQKGKKLIVLDYKTRGYPVKDDTKGHYQDQLDIYSLLLRKNGYETEDYAYLLFFHPDKVNEKGDVIFHKDLIKMDISVENAERIFKSAVKVLEGEMPDSGKECGFCSLANDFKPFLL